MPVPASELMELVKCYCGVGGSNAERLIMGLLAYIVENGTGGSGCTNTISTGSPVGSVTPDCVGQFYTATDFYGAGQHALWQATGATSADWHNWI